MVDLSKHLARAKQALDKRNFDMAIEITEECQEVDPTNVEVVRLLVEAARRRAKESGKSGGLFGMGTVSMPTLSKDPHKQLTGAIKRAGKAPDAKGFAAAGDAAYRIYQGGTKQISEVAIFLYEEVRATGMFNGDVLFNLAHLYYEKFKNSGNTDGEALDKALKTMGELERAVPNHTEAGRLLKNWEASKSMLARQSKASGGAGDYRAQLTSSDKAHRQEAMNRIIRTPEEAREVISYIDDDLKANPADKSLMVKKGDIYRRINDFANARAAFEQAQQVDPHDFVVTMRIGDTRIDDAKAKIAALEAAQQDATAAKQELVEIEIEEYRKRVERQPTESGHRYNLALRLLQGGQIDEAAAELQQTVRDPRLRKQSHRYLGHCFTKKRLFDLAIQQYESYLKLCEDDSVDEAKLVRFSRARLYEESGKKAEAIADYTRIVEMDLGYKDAAARLSALQGG
ncbi:MAG: tetratricopeptide repeat protein [Planctomycetes bacterium]|nr:tetratricopeptide repeat protein [Planctomycetota bacterium]